MRKLPLMVLLLLPWLAGCKGTIDTSENLDLRPDLPDGLRAETQLVDGRGPDTRSPDTVSICQSWETHFQGHCYTIQGINWMDYDTARQTCVTSGAKPVSITSSAENQVVYNILHSFTEAAWIGLKRTGTGSSSFIWESQEALGYTNWASGEPDNKNSTELCGAIMGPGSWDTTNRGKWIDQPCGSSKRDAVLCERVP